MTPPREWLKPPRSLLTILFLVTLVSVSALGWFGWKLPDQERVVEAQRAQERLEQAADRGGSFDITGRRHPASPAIRTRTREAAAFSEVVAQAWTDIDRNQGPRGQTTMWVGERPWFLIWRAVPGRKAVLVIQPESLLKSIFSPGDVFLTAVDGEGRIVAGRRTGTGHAVVRTPAETQLPWTLY